MEIEKPVLSAAAPSAAASGEQKNRPLALIIAVVLLVGLLASALYLYFAKSAIQDQQKQLDTQIGSLTTQIAQLKTQNLEGQQFARSWLAQLEKSEVRWSQVIKTVQDLIPADSLTQKPKVTFLSYSGSAGGKLTLNAQTVAGSVDPFGDISTLLNVFNNSTFFKDGYVPSISHGTTQTGQDILTFVFNVGYEEQLPTLQPLTNVEPVAATSTPTPVVMPVPTATSTKPTQQVTVPGVKVPRNS